MSFLALELKRTLAGENGVGFDKPVYRSLVKVLAERTGKNFGADPCAWAKWWDTARVPYAAPALDIDAEAARKAFAQYEKLKAAK